MYMYMQNSSMNIAQSSLCSVLTGKDLSENEMLTDLERECVYMFMKKKQEENTSNTPMTAADVSNIVSEQLGQRFGRFGT